MSASSDLIFIIGRQRSGTTVVRELLEKHGAFNADEIMHGDLSRPHRFYAFVRDKVLQDHSFVHPQRHAKLFEQYLEELRETAGGRKIAIDLKYFGLNLIPAHGDLASRKPFLIRFIKNKKAHVIHVVRKNKLRVLVSEMIAISTGKWSAKKESDLPSVRPRIRLEMQDTIQRLNILENEDRIADELLESLPDRHNFVYEEMFEANGDFAPHIVACASGILGVPGMDPKPTNMRMNPEKIRDLVENYEELSATLQSTRFAWMLENE